MPAKPGETREGAMEFALSKESPCSELLWLKGEVCLGSVSPAGCGKTPITALQARHGGRAGGG